MEMSLRNPYLVAAVTFAVMVRMLLWDACYHGRCFPEQRHHLAQTMCILNTEGCNIFENVSSSDYARALDLIRDIILATDMAHHLRILEDVHAMADGESTVVV